MTQMKQTAFRFSEETMSAIKQLQEILSVEMGTALSQADIVRMAVSKFAEANGVQTLGRKPKRLQNK